MEIELKYLIDDREKIAKIFEDPEILILRQGREIRHIPMKAVYYDTPDRCLQKHQMVLRLRREGDGQVATLKWDGGSEKGMHRRQECNVPMKGEVGPPDISVFRGEDAWEVLRPLEKEAGLVPLMTMEFLRLETELRRGAFCGMLSVDEGKILAGAGKEEEELLCELEIELVSGEEDMLREIGREISERFGLIPCDTSKFQRGLDLDG